MTAYYGTDGEDLLLGGQDNDVLLGDGGADLLKGKGGPDVIHGGTGDDVIAGGGGNDVLYGDAGLDTVRGGGGNDLLFGGDGDDLLIGARGADFLDGGAGNDTYRIVASDAGTPDTISDGGGTGTDVIDGTRVEAWQPAEVFSGASGIEIIRGHVAGGLAITAGNAPVDWDFGGVLLENVTVIRGGAGNDVIAGGGGNDVIKGGAGDDWLSGAGGDDTVAGGKGADDLQGLAGADTLKGGGAGDELYGGAGADVLKGGKGTDILDGGDGQDVLRGGAGADVLRFDPDDLLVDGQSGNGDVVDLAGVAGLVLDLGAVAGSTLLNVEALALGAGAGLDAHTLLLDKGAVRDLSTTSDALVVTGDGSDAVQSGFAWQQLADSEGFHVYVAGTVTLRIQDGIDVTGLNTRADDAPIFHVDSPVALTTGVAGAGATLDAIHGSDVDTDAAGLVYTVLGITSGHIELAAAPGVVVTAFTQADIDAGQVRYFLDDGDARTDLVLLSLSDGTNTTDSQSLAFVFNVVATGGTGNDILDGSPLDDILGGGAGDDVLVGGDGDDMLDGGAGNDHLYGGAGADTLTGGDGFDTVYFDHLDTGVVVSLGSGFASGDGIDTLAGIEGIVGGAGNDLLTGDDGINELWGGAGDDVLSGRDGDDLLAGGTGEDILAGGGGNDLFLFTGTSPAEGPDSIEDFEGAGVGGGDVLLLYTPGAFDDFSTGTGAVLAAEFESGDGLTAATASDTRLIYDTATGNLYYDADGDGTDFAAVLIVTLVGSPDGLDHGDFQLINS